MRGHAFTSEPCTGCGVVVTVVRDTNGTRSYDQSNAGMRHECPNEDVQALLDYVKESKAECAKILRGLGADPPCGGEPLPDIIRRIAKIMVDC